MTKKMTRLCEYGNHQVSDMDLLCYTDIENGVLEDTHTCRKCYNKHILKFYPNSKVAEHIRAEKVKA